MQISVVHPSRHRPSAQLWLQPVDEALRIQIEVIVDNLALRTDNNQPRCPATAIVAHGARAVVTLRIANIMAERDAQIVAILHFAQTILAIGGEPFKNCLHRTGVIHHALLH